MPKDTTTKGAARKRAPSLSLKERSLAIITRPALYDDDTRRSIALALADNDGELRELVRRAERGDTILDCREATDPPADDLAALAFHLSEVLRLAFTMPPAILSADFYDEVADAANDYITSPFLNDANSCEFLEFALRRIAARGKGGDE